MTDLSQALQSEPLVPYLNKPMPRVWMCVEILGRNRVICVEYDEAPAERATDYPGYLHATRAWLGDFEITDILERADMETLAEMIRDGRTA